MKHQLPIVVLLSALVGLVSCGGGSGSEGAATESTNAAPTTEAGSDTGTDASSTVTGTCNVTGSGDLALRIDHPSSPVATTSDYWMSDDELEQGNQIFDDFETRMESQRQIFFIFQLSCGDADQSVLLTTTDWTTRDDFPQGPGTHAILPSLHIDDQPGVQAGVTLDDPSLFVVDGGTLALTRFDNSGVAGTFTFDASELDVFLEKDAIPRHLHYEGSFDVPCVNLSQSRCER